MLSVEVRQGVTMRRCRLFWLTNSVLVYEPKCGGRGRGELRGLSHWVQKYTEAQINFVDLTPDLTYEIQYTQVFIRQGLTESQCFVTDNFVHKKLGHPVSSPHPPFNDITVFPEPENGWPGPGYNNERKCLTAWLPDCPPRPSSVHISS
jgi:hypothetical protein